MCWRLFGWRLEASLIMTNLYFQPNHTMSLWWWNALNICFVIYAALSCCFHSFGKSWTTWAGSDMVCWVVFLGGGAGGRFIVVYFQWKHAGPYSYYSQIFVIEYDRIFLQSLVFPILSLKFSTNSSWSQVEGPAKNARWWYGIVAPCSKPCISRFHFFERVKPYTNI